MINFQKSRIQGPAAYISESCMGRIVSVFCFICLISQGLLAFPVEANVAIRLMGVNPSKEQNQLVVLKAYMPKEIEPDDVVDMADLEMIYDPQQGAYYVYGEYDLAPGEMVEKEIEIKDTWVIPEEQLTTLRQETEKTIVLLEKTEFKARARFLKENIDIKLQEIEEAQKAPSANPQKHISDYRENVRLLESVKTDLLLARSLLSQAEAMPSISVWKVFLGITLFLGLLGLSFFFFWARHVKVFSAPPVPQDLSDDDILSPQEHKTQNTEKVSPEDIEKMISEEGEK